LFNQKSTIVNKKYVTTFWAFQQLKGMYPNLVTCIAHGLHRVCESIRENYNGVNYFIAALKKILVKAPSRQVLYQEVTGLHLPQFSVITRWGTWIRCENFDKTKCLSLDRCSSHQAGPTISNKDLEFSAWFILYCIVLKGWSLLPNALRPFEIHCAPPNLGIRT